MTEKRADAGCVGGVPEQGRPIIGSRHDPATVGAEESMPNQSDMPLKDRYLGTVFGIPQAGGFIDRGGDDASAIWAEGGRQDRTFMSPKNGQFFSGRHLP